jgi:transposase
MAQHYLLASKSKNIALKDIFRLTKSEAFHLLKAKRWGNPNNIRDVCCPHCAVFAITPIFSNLANAGAASIANVIFTLPPTPFSLFINSRWSIFLPLLY